MLQIFEQLPRSISPLELYNIIIINPANQIYTSSFNPKKVIINSNGSRA